MKKKIKTNDEPEVSVKINKFNCAMQDAAGIGMVQPS